MRSTVSVSKHLQNARNSERIGLSTLEDISHLILQSHGLDETLSNIVTLVSKRMGTEVCSIYLADEGQLTLRASVGLASEAIGKTKLCIGQGLVGHTAQTCTIVNVVEPQQDERFCYVVDSAEEIYHSFLGIPLFNNQNLLGVMAIQTMQPRVFSEIETSTLSTIAFQLSTVVASARMLDQLDTSNVAKASDERLQSKQSPEPVSLIKASHGFGTVAVGPAFVVDNAMIVPELCEPESIDEIDSDLSARQNDELERLADAFAAAKVQTVYLEKKVAERLDERDAAIFHSHLLILQDQVFIDKIQTLIRSGHDAIHAVRQVVAEYVHTFNQMKDPYLRARGADVREVGGRLLRSFCNDEPSVALQLKRPGIVVASELMASDIAIMDLDQVQGIVLEQGDANSHAVIVAKSLGIPTLVGAEGVTKHVDSGTPLVLDAQTHSLHISPTSAIRTAYEKLQTESVARAEELLRFVDQPAATSDGTQVVLRANIGLRSDVDVAIQSGACGVGLYRTELPYMARTSFPDRQTQYEIYRHVVEGFQGQSVTIRTLDIGGDKSLSYFDAPEEQNPFLGWRSVRISLQHPETFQVQLEAILMAATHGDVRVMFPMLTNIDEIVACRKLLAKAKENLTVEGWNVPDVAVGMMIETPATVTMADQFAEHVDFFSLGTNDLIQYLLAADRGNAHVRQYYQSLHPAVLRAIASVVDVASKHGKGLSICGEMVSDPATLAILVGLGLREFSVSSPAILPLKAMLAEQDITQLNKLANDCLDSNSTESIEALANKVIKPILQV